MADLLYIFSTSTVIFSASPGTTGAAQIRPSDDGPKGLRGGALQSSRSDTATHVLDRALGVRMMKTTIPTPTTEEEISNPDPTGELSGGLATIEIAPVRGVRSFSAGATVVAVPPPVFLPEPGAGTLLGAGLLLTAILGRREER